LFILIALFGEMYRKGNLRNLPYFWQEVRMSTVGVDAA